MDRRVGLAFIVSPLVVPFVVAFVPVPGRHGDGGGAWSLETAVTGLLTYSVYALPIAYAVELFLGMPAWLLFQRYGVRSPAAFALGGAVLGWLFNAIMQCLGGNVWSHPIVSLFNPWWNPYVEVDTVAGFACALVFRAIVVPRRRAPVVDGR